MFDSERKSFFLNVVRWRDDAQNEELERGRRGLKHLAAQPDPATLRLTIFYVTCSSPEGQARAVHS